MTAHIVVSAVDPVYPATLSPDVIDGVLRDKIGYDGVVVSDCLEMKAVSDFAPIEDLVERGVRAGVDLFLICHTEDKWRRAAAHLIKVANEDDEFKARIYQSVARIQTLKQDFLGNMTRPWQPIQGWKDILGCDAHQELVKRAHASPNDSTEKQNIDPTES